MMTLGIEPVARPLLDRIVSERIEDFRRFALNKGVPETEVDEVINETFLYVSRLAPQGKILQHLTNWKPELDDELRANLSALFVHFLRLKCLDYHRRKKRYGKHEISFDQQIASGNSSLLLLEDQNLRIFLLETGLFSNIDLKELDEGDLETRLRLIELIAERAGLTPQQRDFLIYRAKHPQGREQDFDPLLSPSTITRLKQAAFNSLLKFLDV